jgi:hypothetical protein
LILSLVHERFDGRVFEASLGEDDRRFLGSTTLAATVFGSGTQSPVAPIAAASCLWCNYTEAHAFDKADGLSRGGCDSAIELVLVHGRNPLSKAKVRLGLTSYEASVGRKNEPGLTSSCEEARPGQ